MATVEIELRNYERRDGTRPIVLRVTSGNEVSRKNTGLYVKAAEWDDRKRQVNRKHPEWTRLNDALEALRREAEGLKADAIKDRVPVCAASVTKAVFATRDFFAAAEAIKLRYDREGKYSTKKNYASMIALLKRYKPEVAIEDITPKFLEEYQHHLRTLGKKHNTVVFHLSKISAVLGTVELKGPNPFTKVTVGSYRRSTEIPPSMEDIRKIRTYIPYGRWQAIAKDTFLFSFYAAGMSSSDVLQLRPEEIADGRINFGRNKVKDITGVQLSLPINPILREIISRQDLTKSTVFGLVTHFGEGEAACREREKIQTNINRALKMIALNSGITKPLKYKMARTAFAQVANETSGRDVYSIQQAMGHSKIATTEIYLGSDNKAIDELLGKVYG